MFVETINARASLVVKINLVRRPLTRLSRTHAVVTKPLPCCDGRPSSLFDASRMIDVQTSLRIRG